MEKIRDSLVLLDDKSGARNFAECCLVADKNLSRSKYTLAQTVNLVCKKFDCITDTAIKIVYGIVKDDYRV